MNEILGKGKQSNKPTRFKNGNSYVETSKDIAEAFNNYYCNVGQDTINSLRAPLNNFSTYMPNKEYDNFELRETNEIEIKSVISKSKNAKPGPDELPIGI